MHRLRIVSFHKERRPAAAAYELLQLLMLDTRKHGGIADLVAVQMQDRQHRAVADRVEQLSGLPSGRQRTGFRLTIPHDAGHNQIRIVERGAEGMTERVAQLTAFVNGPWSRRGDMTGNAPRKGKLLEQLLKPRLVLGDIRINLTPRSFEIHIANDRGAPMT